VKPAARASSSGVETVLDEAELRDRIAGYPDHEVLLVERKVIGPEYSVESLVQRGRIVFASVTGKETTDSHARTFVELAHSVPTPVERGKDRLLSANRELLESLDFRDGIAHSEWRVGQDGRPVLMEIAGRTPGDGLLVLYHLATGVPLEPEIIRIALGEDASYPEPKRHTRQVYLEHGSGVLEDVTADWPGVEPVWIGDSGVWPEILPGTSDGPTLRAVLVLKSRGSVLVPPVSSDDRVVTFFIDAPTPGELDDLEKRVRESLTIQVRSGGSSG
jgi:hypothetical protein